MTVDGEDVWIATWYSTDSLENTVGVDSDILFSAFFVPLTDAAEVWVDFAWAGVEVGTFDKPFDTLTEGVDAVSDGGTIHIRGGQSAETPIIEKAVRLEAFDGTAVIGKAGG